MSEIVRTVTRWLSGFIILYGIYIVAYGHLTPGGGFPGGVILGCGYILLVIAYGKAQAERNLGLGVAKALDSVGALMFLAMAVLGLGLGAGFFVNFIQKGSPGAAFEVFSSGIIPICNVAIALKVTTSLFAVFVIMATVKFLKKGEVMEYTSEEEE